MMNQKTFNKWPLIAFLVFFILPMLGNKAVPIIIVLIAIFFLYKKFGPLLTGVIPNMNMPGAIDVNSLNNMNKFKNSIVAVVVLAFAAWLFFASIIIVDAGETGVYSLFGRVKDSELRSGFHLVIPLAKVEKMTIRTEEYTMSIVQGEGKKVGADAISSLTKEGLSVDLDLTVLYRLDEEKASDVYRTVGLNYEEKLIRPTIRTSIRDVIAQYDAKDIYSSKREEAAIKIQEKLSSDLEARGIIIENVLLRNVALPAGLTQSIQEKLQAEQESQKYEFILQKETKEKQRKIIEAEGQRESQKIINESLTTNYLYYQYINQLKDRQGTIYVPTSATTGMPLFKNIGN